MRSSKASSSKTAAKSTTRSRSREDGGASRGRARSKDKAGARAPSPELVDDDDERSQNTMLQDLAKVVQDLHEVEGVGLKDVAGQVGVHLEVPDASKKVNVLVLGSGGCGMDFVEWYIGDKLQNSGVAGYGDYTVVTNGLSSRILHGADAMALLPGANKLDSYAGLSRSFVFQEMAVTKRKLDSVNVIIAPVIEGTVQSKGKGWQEQALAVMRDFIGRNSQSLLRIFRAFDINKDRKVSLPEFRKALENMDLAHLSDPQVAELMNMIDLDQNGYINYEDFVASFKPHPVKYEYDLEASLMAMADSADVILALMDPSTMRFNIREMDCLQMMAEKHRSKIQTYFFLRDHLQAERNLKSQIQACTQSIAERLNDRHLLNIEACYIPRNQVFNGVSRNAVKEVATVLNAKSHAIAMRCVTTSKQNIAKLLAAFVKQYKHLREIEPNPFDRSEQLPAVVTEGSSAFLEADRAKLKSMLENLNMWMMECANKILSSDEKPMQLLRESMLEGVRMAKKLVDAESDDNRHALAAQHWAREQARQKMLLEVESGDVLTWNSPEHLWLWLESIGMDHYRASFEEQSITNSRLLLSLTRTDFEDLNVRMADRKVITKEMETLRVRLHTGKLELYYQALWTLLGQNLITAQELQTVYAILAGDVRVPKHRAQALQDGLRMMHLGLVPPNAVMEVIKDLRNHVQQLLSLNEMGGHGSSFSP